MTGGRILVVDDDAMLRKSVADVLVDEGYDVELASDGVDALAKIHAHPPDVILLDVLMPRMDGKALLETLHANAVTTGISVLVMTALHGFEAHRTLALGATDLVEKPFDIDNLLNKIALAVYRARQHREGGSAAREGSRGIILIAGDNQADIERIERLTQEQGYHVVTLMHVTDELPRLARLLEPRSVILTHRARQVADQAAQAIRREPDLAQVAVVVLDPEGDPDTALSGALG